MSEIIQTELPPTLFRQVSHHFDAQAGRQEFIDAQKQAINRFCDAVEKEAQTQSYISVGLGLRVLCFESAMKKLRAELNAKEKD